MNLLDLIWIVCLCYFQLPSAQARTESFSLADISGPAGLAFRQNNFATSEKYPFETLGGAVAIFDYDNDGAPDLLLLNGSPSPEHLKTDLQSFNRLYRNSGKGSFVDVTKGSGWIKPGR